MGRKSFEALLLKLVERYDRCLRSSAMRHLQLPCRLDKSDAAAPMPPPPVPPIPQPLPMLHQRHPMIYFPPFTNFRNQQLHASNFDLIPNTASPFYGGMCSAFRAYNNAVSPFIAATAGRFASTTPMTNSNAVSDVSPVSCSSVSPFSTVPNLQPTPQQHSHSSESKTRLPSVPTTAEEFAATLSRLIPQRSNFGCGQSSTASLGFENGKRPHDQRMSESIEAAAEMERKRTVETQFPMPQELLPLMPLITDASGSRSYAIPRPGGTGETFLYFFFPFLYVSNLTVFSKSGWSRNQRA